MAAASKHLKILPVDTADAIQMNSDLIQAFHEALEKDPAADLLSVVGATYLRAHQRAQYQELSKAGRYNLRTINNLHDEVIARPEINLREHFPSDYPRRYGWAMLKAKAPDPQQQQQPGQPRDWFCDKLDIINTASIVYPLSDQAAALLQEHSDTASYSYEMSLATSLKSLILHSERLFDLSIRGAVVKCSEDIVIKVFPDSRDLTEYHNLQYLAEHACDLPIPRPHSLRSGISVLCSCHTSSVSLDKVWPSLSHDAKLSLQKQLDLIFS
ncbi:hypothetical protein EMCG_04322 [[Emmonsia] crescens]|uniref:Uncharacterized protein n=1 Tax=[Emmonsia] crescens TaxID=73230 RepID=A0A0G2HSM9_9EURO|nr:hypothetical protein EMCG_04322 [Emmonsia crescens UAMH 3008]